MKMTIDIECSPAEARAFLGLPDVEPLNDHLVAEMRRRMDENLEAMRPEELMKSWFAFGGQATEQFRKLMMAATGGSPG
ncbi:MAG: hypothetical protein JWO33_1691 [Caulobacteraceae bacterium]|jgi:hypothetical protein|nr:hypothetical protein [Caulobacteraceae bacterium]